MGESKFKNPFASGLGRSGKIAAWFVAIGIVAGWNYYDQINTNLGNNSKEGQNIFTESELKEWNEKRKNAK